MAAKIRKTICMTIILIALFFLCCSFFNTRAYADDLPYYRDYIFFVSSDSTGDRFTYLHSDKVIGQDGTASFAVLIDSPDPTIYLSNLTDTEYTSLDPEIVEVTQYNDTKNGNRSAGKLTLKNAGTATIRIDIPASEEYAATTMYCNLTVEKNKRWTYFYSARMVDGERTVKRGAKRLGDGQTDENSFSFYMDEPAPELYTDIPGVVFSSSDESVLRIDTSTGAVTLNGPGTATVAAKLAEDDITAEQTYYCKIQVRQKDGLEPGYTSSVTKKLSDKGYQISVKAKEGVQLSYASRNTNIATVDSKGYVKFLKAGTATIAVTYKGTKYYKGGTATVTVTITGTSSGTSQSSGSSSASALKPVIPKLTKPTIKCSTRYKGANKLTWTKVKNASGYELYILYPGTKKYVKALTKDATVKSVTHRGIKSGRNYFYRIRAFVKVGGKKYYGPFSTAIKVKVR